MAAEFRALLEQVDPRELPAIAAMMRSIVEIGLRSDPRSTAGAFTRHTDCWSGIGALTEGRLEEWAYGFSCSGFLRMASQTSMSSRIATVPPR